MKMRPKLSQFTTTFGSASLPVAATVRPLSVQRYTCGYFYAPQTRSGGHIVFAGLSVCLFVCHIVCLFEDNFNIGHNF